MSLTDKQERLISLLPAGDDEPRNAKYIATILNMSVRAVRQEINNLITRHGIPIGSKRSNGAGYYLIENEEQKEATLRPFIRQVDDELARTTALPSIYISDFYAKKKAGAFTD